jgi:Holliday junction resolvase
MLGQKEVEKGKVREANIARKLRKKGFQVLNAKNYNTGVDILAIDPKTGQIKEAIESTNYAKKCYIAKKRADRYSKSLNQFPYARKKVVVSYKENVGDEARKIFEENGIKIEYVGHQDLPLDDERFREESKRKVKTIANNYKEQTE